MPLRIAFDLDGVLADMDSELALQAERLFGKAITQTKEPAAQVPPSSTTAAGAIPDEIAAGPTTAPDAGPDPTPPLLSVNLTTRQQRRLWRHVATIDNFWETLAECEPGVVARLAQVATDRRWEIIFLTKRPRSGGATAQVQTQRWLESKGFRLPSVFVVQKSRGRIAAAMGLDIVIDDRPENCLDVVMDSTARAILVWRPDRKLLPAAARQLGIGVVTTVNECLDILPDLDTTSTQLPGVAARAMRLLGLKEPANA